MLQKSQVLQQRTVQVYQNSGKIMMLAYLSHKNKIRFDQSQSEQQTTIHSQLRFDGKPLVVTLGWILLLLLVVALVWLLVQLLSRSSIPELSFIATLDQCSIIIIINIHSQLKFDVTTRLATRGASEKHVICTSNKIYDLKDWVGYYPRITTSLIYLKCP